MTLFDLLFVLVFLASLATLGTVVASALLGRRRLAVKILGVFAVCLAIYLAISVLVSLTSPQRVLPLGENRCFDDWCIAVDNIARSEPATGVKYRVTFRLSSRARRAPQRENEVVVYLVDEKGQRFEPGPDPAPEPFDVWLQPHQAVRVTRVFDVAGASGRLSLVVGQEGSSSIPGIFIMGMITACFISRRSCCSRDPGQAPGRLGRKQMAVGFSLSEGADDSYI